MINETLFLGVTVLGLAVAAAVALRLGRVIRAGVWHTREFRV